MGNIIDTELAHQSSASNWLPIEHLQRVCCCGRDLDCIFIIKDLRDDSDNGGDGSDGSGCGCGEGDDYYSDNDDDDNDDD